MFFHGEDRKKLHKHINPECLPPSYGGTLPELNYGSKDWYPAMEKYNDAIKKFNSAGFK